VLAAAPAFAAPAFGVAATLRAVAVAFGVTAARRVLAAAFGASMRNVTVDAAALGAATAAAREALGPTAARDAAG